MDSVLYEIIKIERLAQSITDEAENAKNRLSTEIEQEKERLAAKIEEKVNEQLAQFAADEKKDEMQKTEQIEMSHKQQLDALRELFAANSAKWENEIFETVRKK